MLKHAIFCAAFGSIALIGPTLAQPATSPSPAPAASNIKRTPLQKFDVPGAGYETVIGLAEIAANSSIGRHTHPGIEGGYLIEGELTLMIQGQPDKQLKPGDSWQIPAGTAHDAKTGAAPAKVIASYVVEKGKPLASPAP